MDVRRVSASLKKVVRPFLVACHPDASPVTADVATKNLSLSRQAKAVNLEAVQTINGLIDALADLILRCTPEGSRRPTTSLPELNSRYEVEFILPTGSGEGPTERKPRKPEALTRRSVTLAFPAPLRSDVRRWALTSFSAPHPQEEESWRVAVQLRDHAVGELLRLLAIAGMEAPASSVDEMHSSRQQDQRHPDGAQWTLSDVFLRDLGIDPADAAVSAEPTPAKPKGRSLAFFGRAPAGPSRARPPGPTQAPPPTYAHPYLQHQRQAFVESVPWSQFSSDYDRAFRDAQADWTTTRLELYNVRTPEGRERREKFVSQICGGARIRRARSDRGTADAAVGAEREDDTPEGLDIVAQLVAVRRLSLLLYENFDYLRLETMGRMWEKFVIVLTPPRDTGRGDEGRESGAAFRRQGKRKKLSKWERSLKRRERRQPVSRGRMRLAARGARRAENGQARANPDAAGGGARSREGPSRRESGFKFSYGTDLDQGAGQVTAYVPVDFRDQELVRQLHAHVYNYFDTCCSRVFFWRYGADGRVA